LCVIQVCRFALLHFALLCLALGPNLGVFGNRFALICFFRHFLEFKKIDFVLLCFAWGHWHILSTIICGRKFKIFEKILRF